MKTWDAEALHAALDEVGLRSGQIALCHGSLFALGPFTGGSPVPEAIRDALLAYLGPAGSLVAPTFTFAFCRGDAYDPAVTPSAGMGLLSEAIRRHPAARRTRHPMQSLAVVGPAAADLCAPDPEDAYAPDGPFDRLVRAGARLLLLGATVQSASLVHLAERAEGVPYRYDKAFTAPYEGIPRTYRMYVRDLQLDPKLRLSPVEAALRAAGAWHQTRLGAGRVACCTAADFVEAARALLRADPWALVDRNRTEGGA